MNRRVTLAICVALAAITAIVYWPVHGHDFLNYDDRTEISANRHITGGLTGENIAWALTSRDGANWIPLTRLSWMIDWRLFHDLSGTRGWPGNHWPGGHHLVDAGLHAASGILLFLVLAWMTGRRWPSAAVAALFLVHPLHIESVAWAVERKDTLSGLFWMLTLAAYAWYVRRPGVVRYGLVLAALALGLMAKPMLVTLPLVLLLLDWWPLGRVRGGPAYVAQPPSAVRERSGRRGGSETHRAQPGAAEPQQPAGRLILEKVPLLALAAASCLITWTAQSQHGAVAAIDQLPLTERIGNALVACATYLGKMVVPINLSIFYPYNRNLPLAEVIGAGVLLAALTVLAVALARRRPYATVGWFWFLGTLVPVIGLVQVGSQAMADRYTYIPLLGIFVAAAWGVADLVTSRRLPRWVAAGAGAAAVAACMAVSASQIAAWVDSKTVFEHALGATTDHWLIRNNLGTAYAESHNIDTAIHHFERALALRPEFAQGERNLANALLERGHKGDADLAIAHYREAIRIGPTAGDYVGMGNAWTALGDLKEAQRQYEAAVAMDPASAAAHNNLGLALAQQPGRMDEAIEHFRLAIQAHPEFVDAHSNLATAYGVQGRTAEAAATLRQAIALARSQGLAARADEMQRRLALYEAGRVHPGEARP